jgi:hypothetical protein
MRTITNDYHDAQVLDLGSRVVRGPYLVRFVAESTDANHADDFWAHCLAIHAAKPVASGAISDPAKIRYGYNTGSLVAPRPVFKPRTLQIRREP